MSVAANWQVDELKVAQRARQPQGDSRVSSIGETWTAARTVQAADNDDYLDHVYHQEFAPLLDALNARRRARGEPRLNSPVAGYLTRGEQFGAAHPTGTALDLFVSSDRGRRSRDDLGRAILAEVRREQGLDPSALKGVATDLDAFMAPRRERERVRRAEASGVLARSEHGVTEFAGGVTMAMQDPFNIATMGFGGVGRHVATRLITEGLIQAGIEASQQSQVSENREWLGEELTAEETRQRIIYAAVGGMAMRGAFEGAGKLVQVAADRLTPLDRKLAGALARAEPAPLSDAELVRAFDVAVPPQLRTPEQQAAYMMTVREVEIDASSPFAATHRGNAAHRGKLATAQAELVEPGLPGPAAPLGGSFDMGRFMRANRSAESGGNDAAAAESSSAYGRYQFLRGTWLASYRRTFGQTGESEGAILRKRGDGAVQDRVMETFTRDNINALRRAGVPVSDASAYLAHFLGVGDAIKVLRAGADAPIGSVVRQGSIRANPAVFGDLASAGQLVAWADLKMGGRGDTPAGTGAASGAADDFELDAALAAERGDIEAERARLDVEGRDGDGDDLLADAADLPQLRREAFESEAGWRLAQAESDAAVLGIEPVVTRQSVWAEARERLTTDQGGVVPGALWHPEVGEIAVRWGDAKGGLAHIARDHGEMLDRLPELLETMELVEARSSANRIELEGPDHVAKVRLDYDGKAERWLLTAFTKDGRWKSGKAPPAAEDGGAAGGARDRSPSAGATDPIAAAGDAAKLPPDLAALGKRYAFDETSWSGFYRFETPRGPVTWDPATGHANGAIAQRSGNSADDVRAALGLERSDELRAMETGEAALAGFDDPASARAAAQAQGLTHDLKAAVEAGETEGLKFATREGEGESADLALARLDADELALKALRECL